MTEEDALVPSLRKLDGTQCLSECDNEIITNTRAVFKYFQVFGNSWKWKNSTVITNIA
jgi:hypothetical protein